MERGRTPSTPADRAPRLPRTRSHATVRKAGSATRLNRSSNRRPASSTAHWCSLVWIFSTRSLGLDEARPRRVGVHRRPPGIPATVLRTRWVPSPCARLSRARTTTDPPSRPGVISRRWTCPPTSWLLAGKGNTGTVPTFTMYRSTGSAPSSAPAASPTATPQAFTVASPPTSMAGFGVVSPCDSSTRTAARPASTRLEPVPHLRGFNRWFNRYACLSRLPDPHHLAVLMRPVVVRAASRPPQHLLGQAALSFTGLLRQPGAAGLSPAAGYMAPRGAPCTTWNGSATWTASGSIVSNTAS